MSRLNVGSARRFEEAGFLKEHLEIIAYILSDIESSPEVPFWIVSADEVMSWWKADKFGKTTAINWDKALELLAGRA